VTPQRKGGADVTGVYIAVATQGWLRHETAYALMALTHDQRYAIDVSGLFVLARPIPCARHMIINNFLKTACDFLLMLDDDVVPRGNPLDLVEHDLDVVAMACPVWRPGSTPPIVLNATPVDGSTVVKPTDGPLVEVTQASTSGILIARRVLEHPDMKNPYGFQYDEGGVTSVDDDITFFRKARAAGFRVWVSLNHYFGHVKDVDISRIHDAVKEWEGAGD
jgi:hypothetical protein